MFLLRCPRVVRSCSVDCRAFAHRQSARSHTPLLQIRTKHGEPTRPSSSRPPFSSRDHANPGRSDVHPGDRRLSPDKGTTPHYNPELPRIPYVRRLRPFIWVVAVSSGIYVSLAYLKAREELRSTPQKGLWTAWRPPPGQSRRTSGSPTEVATRAWASIDPVSKLGYSIIGINGAVMISELLVPRLRGSFAHTPVYNVNYTFLTSAFAHAGPLHFFFNMFAVHNFLPAVGYSETFKGDTYHLLSFYMGAALLSGYGQHLASTVFRQRGLTPLGYTPFLGASGALFGILGVFGAMFPNAKLGLIFIPYYAEVQIVLPAIMAFDLAGMVWGFPGIHLGHAAHLTGITVGLLYARYNGRENVWRPLVEFWKRRL